MTYSVEPVGISKVVGALKAERDNLIDHLITSINEVVDQPWQAGTTAKVITLTIYMDNPTEGCESGDLARTGFHPLLLTKGVVGEIKRIYAVEANEPWGTYVECDLEKLTITFKRPEIE